MERRKFTNEPEQKPELKQDYGPSWELYSWDMFYEKERREGSPNPSETLYDVVADLEKTTVYELYALTPKERVEHLTLEVRNRIRITQIEIFKMGRLLIEMKKACAGAGIGFEKWIKKEFDFSLKTANNFMHVYQYCLGQSAIVMKIPISILYRICTPNFPAELRDFLFTKGNLSNMPNKGFRQLVAKFMEGGSKAIESDVEKITRIQLAWHQTEYAFDMAKKALITLHDLKTRISMRGGTKDFVPIDMACEGYQPIAREINMRLYTIIDQAYLELYKAFEESRIKLDTYRATFSTEL